MVLEDVSAPVAPAVPAPVPLIVNVLVLAIDKPPRSRVAPLLTTTFEDESPRALVLPNLSVPALTVVVPV